MTAWQMRPPNPPVRLVGKTGARLTQRTCLQFLFTLGSALLRRPLFVPARRARNPPDSLRKNRGQMMPAWQMWPRPEEHRVADGQIPPFLSGLLLRTGVDPVLFSCASEARPRGCLLLACATNEDECDRLADVPPAPRAIKCCWRGAVRPSSYAEPPANDAMIANHQTPGGIATASQARLPLPCLRGVRRGFSIPAWRAEIP
jgi:hypothetical protein